MPCPKGGSLLLDARNAVLERKTIPGPTGLVSGRYVVLTVADSGHGMSTEALKKNFRTIFTTKKGGKGTGPRPLDRFRALLNSHGGFY